MVGTNDLFVRNPALTAYWNSDQLVVFEPVAGKTVRMSHELLSVLEAASAPTTLQDLAQLCVTAEGSIERMAELGLLLDFETAQRIQSLPWSPTELTFQRRTRRGGKANPPPDYADMPRLRKDAPAWPSTALPQPEQLSNSYWDVVRARRSAISFTSEPVEIRVLSNILAPAAVVDDDDLTARSWRGYPSASARHPLELYVLASAISGLPQGTYWYNPFEHELHLMPVSPASQGRVYEDLRQLAGAEQCGGYPAAALLITAVFGRTLWKYRDLGLSLVYKDAGCLTHALSLSATAQNVGVKPVGGGDEYGNASLLGLDPLIESQVAGVLVGVANNPGQTGHRV